MKIRALVGALSVGLLLASACAPAGGGLEVAVSFDPTLSEQPLDGRVIVIIAPPGETEPRFQVSSMVGAPVVLGVDVEVLRPVARATAIAARWFGEAEARKLEELPEAKQEEEFMRLWTGKEALAKRHGAGLRLMKGEPGELDVQGALDDGTLRYVSVADGYAAAVATDEIVSSIEIIRPGSEMWII